MHIKNHDMHHSEYLTILSIGNKYDFYLEESSSFTQSKENLKNLFLIRW